MRRPQGQVQRGRCWSRRAFRSCLRLGCGPCRRHCRRRGPAKLRHRDTVEALVGAVTGTLARPDRLILAVPDPDRGLIVAGGTARLTPAQSVEVAAFLRPQAGPHPWPTVIPAARSGVWGGEPLQVTLVEPTLVVEVLADTAHQYGHWRHVVRYVRARPDLAAIEIPALPIRALRAVNGRVG